MFLCVRLQMLCYAMRTTPCILSMPVLLHSRVLALAAACTCGGVMRIHVLGWSVDGSGACTAPPNYSRVLVLVALRLLILFVVDCHCLYDDDDETTTTTTITITTIIIIITTTNDMCVH